MILGAQLENMSKLLNIFYTVYQKKKISSDEVDAGIKQFMIQLSTNDTTKAKLLSLNLSEDMKAFINKVTTN